MEDLTLQVVLKFIMPELLILIPFLLFLGKMLKTTPGIDDWKIPYILGAAGIIFAVLIVGFNKGFTAENIVISIIQGFIAAGLTVYVYNLYIQSTKKRVIDKNF